MNLESHDGKIPVSQKLGNNGVSGQDGEVKRASDIHVNQRMCATVMLGDNLST